MSPGGWPGRETGVLPVTWPAAARGKGRENGRSRNTKRSITSAPAPARDPAMITKDLVLHAVLNPSESWNVIAARHYSGTPAPTTPGRMTWMPVWCGFFGVSMPGRHRAPLASHAAQASRAGRAGGIPGDRHDVTSLRLRRRHRCRRSAAGGAAGAHEVGRAGGAGGVRAEPPPPGPALAGWHLTPEEPNPCRVHAAPARYR
jgi:hypothetical protein